LLRGYYFITDHALSAAGVESDVRQAVTAGVNVIQYRNKVADTRNLYQEAQRMKAICLDCPAWLIINDRIDIALAVDADGVHLGQDDLPYQEARRFLGRNKIIGITVHSVAEALAAESLGADYLGVSPIFPTATKSNAGRPCGANELKAIRKACRIPIVAIGGIDLANVGTVIEAGADMVCAISAVVTHPEVATEIRKFQKEFGL
jgi:thiamine-phosphate pyrophosphorylase